MQKFHFQNEISKLVENKTLTAVRFKKTPGEFKVAYLIDVNTEFTTLAEIDERGELDGVCMYRSEEISSFSTHTQYMSKLEEKIDSSLLEHALEKIEKVKEFNFRGFAKAFENTDTLVEVEYQTNFGPAGKIIGYDEEALLLHELDEHDGVISHALIKFSSITCMSIDIPYMRVIVASLKK